MPHDRPKPALYLSVFDARFDPRLQYLARILDAGAMLEGYPDWITDTISLTLRNYERHRSVLVQHNLLRWRQDLPGSPDEEECVAQLLDTVPKSFGISSFKRLATLRRYVVPLDTDYSKVIDMVKAKLLSSGLGQTGVVGIGKFDFNVVATIKEPPFTYNLKVGPIQRDQYEQIMPPDIECFSPKSRQEDYRTALAGYPQQGIFIEVDYAQDGAPVPADSAKAIAKETRNRAHMVAKRVNDYILDSEVKV